jgi:hypothetical protein
MWEMDKNVVMSLPAGTTMKVPQIAGKKTVRKYVCKEKW